MKHRTFLIFILLIIVIVLFNAVHYMYNDFAYGRFIKISNALNIDFPRRVYSLGSDQILVTDKNRTAIFNVKNGVTVYNKSDISDFYFNLIQLSNNSFLLAKPNKTGGLEETMIYNPLDDTIKEGPKMPHIRGHLTMGDNKAVLLFYNPQTRKSSLGVYGFVEDSLTYVAHPFGKNLQHVIMYAMTDGRALIKSGKEFYFYSVKENKFKRLENFEYKKTCKSVFCSESLVWLGDNRFLIVSSSSLDDFAKGFLCRTEITIDAYEIKNNTVIHLGEYKKTSISERTIALLTMPHLGTANYSPLDREKVLITGINRGIGEFGRSTKEAYIYNIADTKLVKINDTPFSASISHGVVLSDGNIVFDNLTTQPWRKNKKCITHKGNDEYCDEGVFIFSKK